MLNKQHIILSTITLHTGWILSFVQLSPFLSLINIFHLLPSLSYFRDLMIVAKKDFNAPQKGNPVEDHMSFTFPWPHPVLNKLF